MLHWELPSSNLIRRPMTVTMLFMCFSLVVSCLCQHTVTPTDFLHILANWSFIIMYFLIQCYVVPAVNIVLLNKTINISMYSFLLLQAIIFLCDVFLLTVIILSGYDSFVLTLGSIVSSRESRLLLFPQALLTLLSRDQWKSVAPKVSLPLSA